MKLRFNKRKNYKFNRRVRPKFKFNFKFKLNLKLKIIAIISAILLVFAISVYYLDKNIMPAILEVSDVEVKSKITEVINKNIGEVYSKKFNYSEIMNIEKDESGNIILLQADTVKLNNIATEMILKSQEEINKIGDIGVRVPVSYAFKNTFLSYWSPKMTVKIVPIGRIETKYNTTFESAGINQTRHKIYIDVYSKARIILPLVSKDIEVKTEVPISETIIVGKIPKSALSFEGLNLK